MVELQKIEGEELQGKKRQRMPYKLEWTCIECGSEQAHEFHKHRYLSYPTFGAPEEVFLYCDNCENEQTITVVPELKLELADEVQDRDE